MAWGDDVALYNTAVNALGAFIVARDGNTSSTQMITLKNAAQAAVDAIATPLSGTLAMPKTHPPTS